VVVGVNKYFEIWSPERWRETVAAMDEETDQLVAQLTSLKY
jgi:DNA-binding transcriptional regulator/RsmH inhibitor MraZ